MTTIQNVIDDILSQIEDSPFDGSVDTVKAGDPEVEVTGIVSTFMATHLVLQRAVELGANFVITHEPTFYNHLDETDWLADDPVYAAKRAYLDEHGLVVWRFHDHWHAYEPDGIYIGVLDRLGWTDLADGAFVTLPKPVMFSEVIQHVADRLGVESPRVIGDPAMPVTTVGLLVGAPGGRVQISLLPHVHVLIAGEVAEWETTEWVRDSITQGSPKGLMVAGHQHSEEAGMDYLAQWLRERQPTIPIWSVSSGDPFSLG
jgi:putative NIF3 family GTP cyclohydrolase 1 type 2